MNEYLTQLYTEKEIIKILNQICPTKALGPNGLPTAFYQKHWPSINEGVINTCLQILNEAYIIAPLNYTYIALVPKNAKPKKRD